MDNRPHTHLLYIDAVDYTGNVRNLGIIYNIDDNWFNGNGNEQHRRLYVAMKQMISEDENIIGIQGRLYKNENGMYKEQSTYFPSLAK